MENVKEMTIMKRNKTTDTCNRFKITRSNLNISTAFKNQIQKFTSSLFTLHNMFVCFPYFFLARGFRRKELNWATTRWRWSVKQFVNKYDARAYGTVGVRCACVYRVIVAWARSFNKHEFSPSQNIKTPLKPPKTMDGKWYLMFEARNVHIVVYTYKWLVYCDSFPLKIRRALCWLLELHLSTIVPRHTNTRSFINWSTHGWRRLG